jgi:hypothetical protein
MLWEKCDLQWDRDVKESITMRPNSQTCSKQQANGNWVIDQTEEKNIVGNIKGSEALLSLSSYQPQPPKKGIRYTHQVDSHLLRTIKP